MKTLDVKAVEKAIKIDLTKRLDVWATTCATSRPATSDLASEAAEHGAVGGRQGSQISKDPQHW